MAVTPKPIVAEAFVVAAFDGPFPRFLAHDDKRRLVVRTDVDRAEGFATLEAASLALAEHDRVTQGGRYSAPASWRIWRRTTRVTFEPVED